MGGKYTRPVELVRSTACFALATLLLLVAFSLAFSQSPTPRQARQELTNAVEVEHRFTQLETTVQEMAKDIQDIKQRADWRGLIELLGLSGLLGEAGFRIYKRKSQ